jgi:hypothetical protein
VGISWDNRSAYCMNLDDDPAAQEAAFRAGVYQDFDCVFSVNQVLIVMTVEFFLYFLLAVYLDHVLPDENGEAGWGRR